MRLLYVSVCFAIVLALAPSSAMAQETEGALNPDRGGFTLLLNLGVGSQREGDLSAVGLAGLNLGAGGFLTENLALMFRLSGTNATHEFGAFGYDFEISQVSGVAGLTVQHWLDDRFYIEAGPGMGFWSVEELGSESGFGVILGTGVTIFNRGKHNLQLGIEYAPMFTDPTIHNLGFTFGYQFL